MASYTRHRLVRFVVPGNVCAHVVVASSSAAGCYRAVGVVTVCAGIIRMCSTHDNSCMTGLIEIRIIVALSAQFCGRIHLLIFID
jgi:hypothetical protein